MYCARCGKIFPAGTEYAIGLGNEMWHTQRFANGNSSSGPCRTAEEQAAVDAARTAEDVARSALPYDPWNAMW